MIVKNVFKGDPMQGKNAALLIKEEVIREVVCGRRKRSEAARELGVTSRTVHNYFQRFLKHGPEGLKDQRRGSYRKITSVEEAAIVASKRERPLRSARLIRNRLKLRVSEETVRLILVKHRLNGKSMESNSY